MVALKGVKPCIHCKGAHKETDCPLYRKSLALYKVKELVKSENFAGSAPSPFVGRFGYPNINLGILAPPEVSDGVWRYDAPRTWSADNTAIPEIVGFRSSLINSRANVNVRSSTPKLLSIAQEVAMASNPVDIEFHLKKIPAWNIHLDGTMAPMGPAAAVQKADITSNPKIHSKVDKVVSDSDMKAVEAVSYLSSHGFDEHALTKLLSVGTLGIGANRKLVPTRWSITSVDSMLGNLLISSIKDYSLSGYSAYFGGHLGNYFLVLCFPEVFSYELFENYIPQAGRNMGDPVNYSTDYEPYDGRTTYAENCAGGFYACRMSILEKLNQIKRQASVLVIRVTTEEYTVPLGVWVVREATRKALANKPIEFASSELMLMYAKNLMKRKFKHDISEILRKSILLNKLKTQSKLSSFL
jgi:hypothetical protein